MLPRILGHPREGSTSPEPTGRQVTLLFFPDPQFYQEILERGLNTSHEYDDEGTQGADSTIVVQSYRPAQVTWSQLPEVGQEGRRSPLPASPSQPIVTQCSQ